MPLSAQPAVKPSHLHDLRGFAPNLPTISTSI
jgi:hypothetical protein